MTGRQQKACQWPNELQQLLINNIIACEECVPNSLPMHGHTTQTDRHVDRQMVAILDLRLSIFTCGA
jgi:hypothetical protein